MQLQAPVDARLYQDHEGKHRSTVITEDVAEREEQQYGGRCPTSGQGSSQAEATGHSGTSQARALASHQQDRDVDLVRRGTTTAHDGADFPAAAKDDENQSLEPLAAQNSQLNRKFRRPEQDAAEQESHTEQNGQVHQRVGIESIA